jgi:hypothetical protein
MSLLQLLQSSAGVNELVAQNFMALRALEQRNILKGMPVFN